MPIAIRSISQTGTSIDPSISMVMFSKMIPENEF